MEEAGVVKPSITALFACFASEPPNVLGLWPSGSRSRTVTPSYTLGDMQRVPLVCLSLPSEPYVILSHHTAPTSHLTPRPFRVNCRVLAHANTWEVAHVVLTCSRFACIASEIASEKSKRTTQPRGHEPSQVTSLARAGV